MFKTEYRVVWKRRGLKRKSKRYMSLKAAQRRIALMGPEPWVALEVNPDDYHCHKGSSAYNECGCDGLTWREHLLNARNQPSHEEDSGMPALEYAFIETRPLAPWQPLSEEGNG